MTFYFVFIFSLVNRSDILDREILKNPFYNLYSKKNFPEIVELFENYFLQWRYKLKKTTNYFYAQLLIILMFAIGVQAQTMTPGEMKPEGNPNAKSICTTVPKVELAGNPGNAADAVRQAFAELLDSDLAQIVPIEAKLPVLAKREIADRDCDYVLEIALEQKQKKKGGGFFGKVLESAGDSAIRSGALRIPYGRNVGTDVARTTAQRAAYEIAAIDMQVDKKDEFILAYELTTGENAAVASKTLKDKADKNGEDVVSPMIETAANDILTAILKK